LTYDGKSLDIELGEVQQTTPKGLEIPVPKLRSWG
jgi:hypothetical protein